MSPPLVLVFETSFARTPLAEISGKAAKIEARGWEENGRGDPWAVSYRKDVQDGDGEAALQKIMGDYWLTADEVRSLLASK
jgi:hypothetical protein